ncbi:hypothetical protein [Hyphomonas sp.]|uniref:phosphorylase family protein n=1 Tax=Hyphomonas sp. TaxID=87 RepID=UPI00391DB20B
MIRQFIAGAVLLGLAGCTSLAEVAAPAAPDVPKATIAIIGGTYMNDAMLFREGLLGAPFTVETKLGPSPEIRYGEANGVPFYYVHGHGMGKWQETWLALYDLGVTDAIGGATAGAINPAMKTYDFTIPHDFIDLNIDRAISFPHEVFRDPNAIPVPRYTPAMDTDLRGILKAHTEDILHGSGGNTDITLHDQAVLVQSRGARFETVAEVKMMGLLGGDLVTMSVGTEMTYSRMLGINYACLVVISNPAEGVADWDFAEMPPLYQRINPLSVDIVLAALPDIAALAGKPRVSDGLINHPQMTSRPQDEEAVH